MRRTPVGDVWGVGGKYARKLREHWTIYDAFQLRNLSEEFAKNTLGGVVGIRLIKELKGEHAKDMEEELVKKKMIATTRMFGSLSPPSGILKKPWLPIPHEQRKSYAVNIAPLA